MSFVKCKQRVLSISVGHYLKLCTNNCYSYLSAVVAPAAQNHCVYFVLLLMCLKWRIQFMPNETWWHILIEHSLVLSYWLFEMDAFVLESKETTFTKFRCRWQIKNNFSYRCLITEVEGVTSDVKINLAGALQLVL